MSRLHPTIKNPATRFMQWRGGSEDTKNEEGNVIHEGGRIAYYDKESKEEIDVPLPFSFLVLDELTTLTGFNDTQQAGYWSNEVRDSTGILVARTKQGIQARGTYQQIKEQGLNGLKFAQSVYVAFKDDTGELQIGNFKLSGAAFSAWVDFKKQFNVEECAVCITDKPKLAKKGKNYYFKPVFEGQNVNATTEAEALKLAEVLDQYLNTYMQRKPEEDNVDAIDEEDEPTYATTAAGLAAQGQSKSDTEQHEEKVEVEDLDKTNTETMPAETKPESDAKKLKPLKDVAF